MSDRKFTILEYHSHGEGISLFSPTTGEPDASADPEPPTSSTEEPSSGVGTKGLGVVLALVILVAIAALVKYFSGGDGEQSYETESVAVTEYEE